MGPGRALLQWKSNNCEIVSAALVSRYAMRMRRIMSSVACLSVPYYSTLSHKR
jgi:hypothetical protein